MPIEKSSAPHSVSHTKFHDNVSYNELHGHANGDGLTSGIIHVTGASDILENPYGSVGVVLEGKLVLKDNSDTHELKQGETFHIKKGSTFQWGAGSNGKAFYAMAKPLGAGVPQSIKKSSF